jgi:hypothetical protein
MVAHCPRTMVVWDLFAALSALVGRSMDGLCHANQCLDSVSGGNYFALRGLLLLHHRVELPAIFGTRRLLVEKRL